MAKDIEKINKHLQKNYDQLEIDPIIMKKIKKLPKGKSFSDFCFKHLNFFYLYALCITLIILGSWTSFKLGSMEYVGITYEQRPNFGFFWLSMLLCVILIMFYAKGKKRLNFWSDVYSRLLYDVIAEYDAKDKTVNEVKIHNIGLMKSRGDDELKSDAVEMMQDMYLFSENVKSKISTAGSKLSYVSMLLNGNGSKVVDRWLSSSTTGEFNVSGHTYRFRNFSQVFEVIKKRTVKSGNSTRTETYTDYETGQCGIIIDIPNHTNSSKFKNFMIAEERNIFTAPRKSKILREDNPFEDIEFNKSFSVYRGKGLSEVDMFNIMSAKAIDKLVKNAPTYPGFILSTKEDGRLQIVIYSPDSTIIPFTITNARRFARDDDFKIQQMKASIYLLISARKIIKTFESSGIL